MVPISTRGSPRPDVEAVVEAVEDLEVALEVDLEDEEGADRLVDLVAAEVADAEEGIATEITSTSTVQENVLPPCHPRRAVVARLHTDRDLVRPRPNDEVAVVVAAVVGATMWMMRRTAALVTTATEAAREAVVVGTAKISRPTEAVVVGTTRI